MHEPLFQEHGINKLNDADSCSWGWFEGTKNDFASRFRYAIIKIQYISENYYTDTYSGGKHNVLQSQKLFAALNWKAEDIHQS